MSDDPKYKQEHIIERQILQVRSRTSIKDVNQFKEKILKLYKTKIGETLDRLLCEMVPPDVHITIDNLSFDLGKVSSTRFEQDVIRKFEKQAKTVIKKKLEKLEGFSTKIVEQGAPKQETYIVLVRHFLQNGTFPSWANQGKKRLSLQIIMDELIRKSPKKIKRVLEGLSKEIPLNIFQKRLVYQLRPKGLERLIELLFGSNASAVLKQIHLIRKRLGNRYKALKHQQSVEKSILGGTLGFFFEQTSKGKKPKFIEKKFVDSIIENIQKRYQHVEEEALLDPDDYKSRVRSRYKGNYNDLDILRYFLEHGSIPVWADIANKSSLQDLMNNLLRRRLVSTQDMINQQLETPYFVQRLVYQFSDNQLLQLFEPTPVENTNFIQKLVREVGNISTMLVGKSQSQIRAHIFQVAFVYGFRKRRNNFMRQAFFQEVVEGLTLISGKDSSEILVTLQNTLGASDPDIKKYIDAYVDKQKDGTKEQIKLQREQQRLQKELEKLEKQIARASGTKLEKLEKQRQKLASELEILDKRTAQVQTELDPLEAIIAEKKDLDAQLEELELQIQRQQEEEQKEALRKMKQSVNKQLKDTRKKLNRFQNQLIRDVLKQSNEVDHWNIEFGKVKAQLDQREKIDSQTAEKLEKAKQQTFYKKNSAEAKLRDLTKKMKRAIEFLKNDKRRLQVLLLDVQKTLGGSLASRVRNRLEKERKQLEEILRDIDNQTELLENTQEQIQLRGKERKTMPLDEFYQLDIESDTPAAPASTSKLDFLIFFLQYGSVPWWASEYRDNSVEEIIKNFISTSSSTLRKALAQVGRNPVVWQRLVNQLSEETLTDILQKLYPQQSGFIITISLMLERIHMSQFLKNTTTASQKYFKWSAIIEQILSKPSLVVRPNDFTKKIVTRISKDFSIIPSELMRAMYNIANNVKGRFIVFQDIMPQVAEEEEMKALELELLDMAAQQMLKDQGLWLSDQQQLDIITNYLKTGAFTDLAKRARLDNTKSIHELLLQQADNNPKALIGVLKPIIEQEQVREVIVQKLPEKAFWTIIQLILPKHFIIVQDYYQDLKKILGDRILAHERDQLLLLIAKLGTQPFDILSFMKALVASVVRQRRRNPVALIQEWVAKAGQAKTQLNSSIYLTLRRIESEFIKLTLQRTTDTSLLGELQRQLQEVESSMPDIEQSLSKVLQFENELEFEFKDEPIRLRQIEKAISQTVNQIERLKAELERQEQQDKPNPEQLATFRRNLTKLQAELILLKKRRPAVLQYLEDELDLIAQNIDKFAKQAETFEQKSKEIPSDINALEESISENQITSEIPPESKETFRQLDHLFTPTNELEQQIMAETTLSASLNLLRAPLEYMTTEQRSAFVQQIKGFQKFIDYLSKKPDFKNVDILSLQSILDTSRTALGELRQNSDINHPEVAELLSNYQAIIDSITPILDAIPDQLAQQQQNTAILNKLAKLPDAQRWLISLKEQHDNFLRNLRRMPPTELVNRWNAIQQSKDDFLKALPTDIDDGAIIELNEFHRQLYEAIERLQKRRFTKRIQNARQELQQFVTRLPRFTNLGQQSILEQDLTNMANEQDQIGAQMERNALSDGLKKAIQRWRKAFNNNVRKIKIRILRQQQKLLEEQASKARAAREKQILEQHQQKENLEKAIRENQRQENERFKADEKATKKPIQKKEAIPPPEKVIEPLHVSNAGIVLLWPYIVRLFDVLGYIDKEKQFVDVDAQIKAVHILQYLATGQKETPENELVLNKIICGLPLNTPVPYAVEFTQDELDTADSLLKGVIANWPRLKTMSPNALRGTFLIRGGSILEESDRWKLTVEKGSFDILLKTLPWGYTFIRLKWMPKYITVDWPLGFS